MRNLPVVVLILLLLAGGRASGQAGAAPSASAAVLGQSYAAAFPRYPGLLNGAEYYDYPKRFHLAAGHQFFIWPEWQNSSVVYNDHLFTGLTLAYDIVLDQLVVLRQPEASFTFRLVNEQVSRFTIGEHRFVRLAPDSAAAPLLRPGFYEVLLDSTATLLARHTKQIHKRTQEPAVDVDFPAENRLFIRRAGRYYEVSTKKSVLLALADREKEVQKYIQKSHLSFKPSRGDADVTQVVRYYNSLPAQ